MGRQYDPLKDLIQPITADGVWGTVNVTPGDLDNYDNSLRVNNSIKYVSPELYGVQLEALYGVGGVAGDVSAGQTAAVAAAYKNQGLTVATGYFTAKYNPSNVANNSSDTISDSLASSGYAAAASSLQIARLAAAYVVGPVTFGGSYSNTRYKPAVSSVAYSKTESFNSLAAFVNYSVTPAALVGLSYSYTNSRGAQSAIYNQLSAGAEYLLSKRTAVYALVGYQRSSGDTFNGKGVVTATASVGDAGFQSASGSQLLTIVGLRHRF
jgi:predicted porin